MQRDIRAIVRDYKRADSDLCQVPNEVVWKAIKSELFPSIRFAQSQPLIAAHLGADPTWVVHDYLVTRPRRLARECIQALKTCE
jgi:hypothetical protein